jgi:type I restriction enzyme S subunit
LNTALYVEDFKGNYPRFVGYLLTTLELGAKNEAGAVPGVNRNTLHQMSVSVPDVDTQVSIATVLLQYDNLIETNRRRIALLEESARLLYREWFVNLRFPGHEQAKIIDGLPAGWRRQPLSVLIETNPKTPFEKGKSYPFVPMQSLSESSMVIGSREERVISGGAKFQNLDTLLARITPCLENGKTGFVQFLNDELPVASGSTEFIVMRSRSVSPYWVYCLARKDSFREHAIRSMAGADGRQRVNPKCFDAYVTLQPPATILSEFDAVVEPMFCEVEMLTRQNVCLQEVRDELLPKLMSGEIQV